MKSKARIVSGLAALAALFFAPIVEASLTRTTTPALGSPTLELALDSHAPELSEFPLFEGHELAFAAAESESAPSFHPLVAVSLLSEDGAETPLVSAEPLRFRKTRIGVFDFLGSRIIGVERELSLELQWGSGRFGLETPEGIGIWLSQDPLGDKDSPNLYGFVGARPHEKTDPLGLESNRQLIGLDTADEDIRQGNLLKGYGKKVGYGLWNALTFGFVERHDKAFEKYERTGDTGSYIADTTKEVVRAGAVGAATIASGGVAGAGARTLTAAVVRGAAAGAVSSVAGTAAGDVVDRAYGEEGASVGDYVSSAAGGALFGGATGAIAPVWRARGKLTEVYREAVARVSGRPNYGPTRVGTEADALMKRWLTRFGKQAGLPEANLDVRRNYPGSTRGGVVDVELPEFRKGFELKLSPKARRASQEQAFEDLFSDMDIEYIFGRLLGKK